MLLISFLLNLFLLALLLNLRVFCCMAIFKSQIEPKCNHSSKEKSPRNPNVPRSDCIKINMSGICSIFITKDGLCRKNCYCKPSISSFHRLEFPFRGVPCSCIFISFSESYCSKSEP